MSISDVSEMPYHGTASAARGMIPGQDSFVLLNNQCFGRLLRRALATASLWDERHCCASATLLRLGSGVGLGRWPPP
jgi:hypothetical protein